MKTVNNEQQTTRNGGMRSKLRVAGFRFSPGFTLIELLTVITVIMILAALVLGAAAFAGRKADEGRCQARIQIIKSALETYKMEYGRYPAVSAVNAPVPYQAGVTPTVNKLITPYFSETNFMNTSSQMVDPWGNYFRYKSPGDHNKATYDLWSFGADGQSTNSLGNDPDDINNWTSGH